MKLDNGRVIFSSYSNYNELTKWLRKKGKRIVPNEPHVFVDNGAGRTAIALNVEEIPKNPPRPKACTNSFDQNNSVRQSNIIIVPNLDNNLN